MATSATPPRYGNRPSITSHSSGTFEAGRRRILSFSSSFASPMLSCVASPQGSMQPQRLAAQLDAWARGEGIATHLKMFQTLHNAMQRSLIFGLFADAEGTVCAVAQQRLRLLPQNDLSAIISLTHEVMHWRQQGLGPAKMMTPKTHLEVVGLIAVAWVMLGQDGAMAACQVAKDNISAQQQVEKRFHVLLLAVAAAVCSPAKPKDFIGLRQHCKVALERVGNPRSKQYPMARQQLLARMGRFLTDKQSEKVAVLPHHLVVGEPFEEVAVADTPSDGQYVHVSAKDCLPHNDAQGFGPSGGARSSAKVSPLEKHSQTKGWLESLGF